MQSSEKQNGSYGMPQQMVMMDPQDSMLRGSGGSTPSSQSKILHTSTVVGTFSSFWRSLFLFFFECRMQISYEQNFLVLPDDFDLQEKK